MLQSLVLQHFRSYTQEKFDFNPQMTIIIGPNTAGKTNLTEAIMLLSSGKSIKAEHDLEMIKFGQDVGRVAGLTADGVKLEITLAQGSPASGRFIKKYTVNNIAKSRSNFVGFLPAILFRPEDLEIIIDGPGLRRKFLDDVLEQTDKDYRLAKLVYDKAIRQRNALLHLMREIPSEEGRQKNKSQFEYWDNLLIENGTIITSKRKIFLDFVNGLEKEIINLSVFYDKSIISKERLLSYKEAEIASGVTLVGPQRDDFQTSIFIDKKEKNAHQFGSRGQQRLVVLQLKIIQMKYMQKMLYVDPILVLDDIFSELDSGHIKLVLEHVGKSQVILTTTHAEFVKGFVKKGSVIKLNYENI